MHPNDKNEKSPPKTWAEKKKDRLKTLSARKNPRSKSAGPETGEVQDSPEAAAFVWDDEKIERQAQDFANRLKKRRAHLWKWARRTGVSCFRIYDRDIPEIPFVVDEYERHLHISQILRNKRMSDDEYRRWTEIMVEAASKALAVEAPRIFVKEREPQKGHRQYEKFGSEAYALKVKEGGLEFEVNLSDYLDTGLFLDHRDTRAMVGGMALNARVLNLFSYTGSFSVYCAVGGALSTLSLDLSNTYTEWARRNLQLNGFSGKLHRCESVDVLQYLPEAVKKNEQFDLIVLDPPTFSNSKRMDGVFDVQRDHAEIINFCLKLLSKKGILVFSNNFRKFKLETAALKTGYIDDITNKTIPEDFLGKKPHRTWVIRRES